METRVAIAVVGVLLAVVMMGSAGVSSGVNSAGLLPATITAPHGMVPTAVGKPGSQAHSSYVAALEMPEILVSVPCTCGCMEMVTKPHENNLDCYIDRVNADGSVTFTTHGIGCGVCQLITRDALDGAANGMSGEDLTEMVMGRYGTK